MYTYRVVLDAYNSRARHDGARIVTYTQGWNRESALRQLGTIYTGRDGTASDGISPWPGAINLPDGPYESRSFPEWEVVSIRSVKTIGKARVL